MSEKKWFYVFNAQPVGPIDETEIPDLFLRGIIHAQTLVWQEGMAGWVALQNTSLQAYNTVQAPPPVQVYNPMQTPPPMVSTYAQPAYHPGYAVGMKGYTAESFNQLFMWFWILLAISIPLSFIYIGGLTAIAAVVVYCILLYRYWDIIQEIHPRTTPGQAVGFMFIPFFNLYWNFVAIQGLEQDMNRYCREKQIPAEPIDDKMAQWYCILSIINLIPIVDFVSCIAAIVLQIMLLSKFNKTAVAIINAKRVTVG